MNGVENYAYRRGKSGMLHYTCRWRWRVQCAMGELVEGWRTSVAWGRGKHAASRSHRHSSASAAAVLQHPARAVSPPPSARTKPPHMPHKTAGSVGRKGHVGRHGRVATASTRHIQNNANAQIIICRREEHKDDEAAGCARREEGHVPGLRHGGA